MTRTTTTAEKTEVEMLREELAKMKEEMARLVKAKEEAVPLFGYMKGKIQEEQEVFLQKAKRSKQQEEGTATGTSTVTADNTGINNQGDAASRGTKRESAEEAEEPQDA